MKTTQPIVNGVAVLRVVGVPWRDDDERKAFDVDGAWRIVGRARVDLPNGGVANGLLLREVDGVTHACVIWERPTAGHAGMFRVLPMGDWS